MSGMFGTITIMFCVPIIHLTNMDNGWQLVLCDLVVFVGLIASTNI